VRLLQKNKKLASFFYDEKMMKRTIGAKFAGKRGLHRPSPLRASHPKTCRFSFGIFFPNLVMKPNSDDQTWVFLTNTSLLLKLRCRTSNTLGHH